MLHGSCTKSGDFNQKKGVIVSPFCDYSTKVGNDWGIYTIPIAPWFLGFRGDQLAAATSNILRYWLFGGLPLRTIKLLSIFNLCLLDSPMRVLEKIQHDIVCLCACTQEHNGLQEPPKKSIRAGGHVGKGGCHCSSCTF